MFENIVSAIGLIGIGAILKSIVDFIIKKREVKSQTQHELKDKRYKAIILLANAMLDFDKHKRDLEKQGRNFVTKDELLEELKLERNNMILYASDKVILCANLFIKESTTNNFYTLAIAMRKDLYGLSTRLIPSVLES